MSVLSRNNVNVVGRGRQAMLFAHGYGCDQSMWRFITPAFENDYRLVLFDHVGHGRSDLSAYNRGRYGTLQGYADDILEICRALELERVIFVGHSVSTMIGILAAIKEPDLFDRLVLVSPSPCYINEGDYVGGFNRSDIEGLLDSLDSNYLGWSSAVAPTIMGTPDRPELNEELTNSFCRTDPDIARHFAHVTFLSDHRPDLPKVRTPSLILQVTSDVIAPPSVGEYMHRQLAGSRLVMIEGTGHCPHMSEPQQTIAAMKAFLST